MNFGFLKKIRENIKVRSVCNKPVNIFVVYHKPALLYKDKLLTPIHAGREVAFTGSKDGKITVDDYKWLTANMIGDNTGENISSKNRFFNEATVIYWIWKNCKSSVVGLMHYRRLFDFSEFGAQSFSSEYRIDKKVLKKLLSENDIILPKKLGFGEETLYEQYKRCHYIEDFDMALNIVREKYPEMTKYVDDLKVSHEGYFFNMFITRKDVFNKYAEFLFTILTELNKKLPSRSGRHIYQQRIEAFIAERLSNIYFNYMIGEMGMRVKELPVVNIENTNVQKRLIIKKSSRPRSLTIFIKFRF